DLDAARGRPAEEDQFGAEHPGRVVRAAGLQRHGGQGVAAGVGQQVGVAGGRLDRGAVDPHPEQLDPAAGDLDPVARPEPAGHPGAAVEPGAGAGDEVDGVDPAGVEVEVRVAGAGGAVVDRDVGVGGAAD